MRFTFFTAVVAACNLITYSQASSLIQNEMQLFEEPATIFSQVDAQPMPKKGGPKEGPKRKKPQGSAKPKKTDPAAATPGKPTPATPAKGTPAKDAPKGPKKYSK